MDFHELSPSLVLLNKNTFYVINYMVDINLLNLSNLRHTDRISADKSKKSIVKCYRWKKSKKLFESKNKNLCYLFCWVCLFVYNHLNVKCANRSARFFMIYLYDHRPGDG